MAKRASYKPRPAENQAPVPTQAPGEKPSASAPAPKKPNAAAAQAAARKKSKKSALSKLRGLLPVAVLVVAAVAFVANVPVGNLSAAGWGAISLICPIGALSTLLASKTLVPQVVISLVIVVLLIVLFGRAFCGWLCSVPVMQRVLGVHPDDAKGKASAKKAKRTSYKPSTKAAAAPSPAAVEAALAEPVVVSAAETGGAGAVLVGAKAAAKHSDGCASGATCGSCGGCAGQRAKALDARHWVLGGSLLSAAIFGFPVFCLVCPVGLTFATIFLVIRLFSGSVSWALLVVPALLIVELVFLRKWCHRFCPIGAFMALVAKANRFFVPTINTEKCIETTTGHACGRCAATCPESIDLRDLARSPRPINECIKCRRCVDVCPKKAITMPVFSPRAKQPAHAPLQVGYDGTVTVTHTTLAEAGEE